MTASYGSELPLAVVTAGPGRRPVQTPRGVVLLLEFQPATSCGVMALHLAGARALVWWERMEARAGERRACYPDALQSRCVVAVYRLRVLVWAGSGVVWW